MWQVPLCQRGTVGPASGAWEGENMLNQRLKSYQLRSFRPSIPNSYLPQPLLYLPSRSVTRILIVLLR